jgi:thymidine phosphorylase
MWLPQEIIRAKRDGRPLSDEEIRFFITGLTNGSVTEGQVAAFAMAVYFKGMTVSECAALTTAMAGSGASLSWDLDGPVLDKHSTGGVGDLVSLILGPMIAACGGFVPMISGRGLGHTGGTLDKLESIPGYKVMPGREEFQRAVREAGVAIIGQTDDLAPADRCFYAIRDVTATVESVPLITASILSKKLAAGLDGLVMDVKTGSGAFMSTPEQAAILSRSLVSVAEGAGLPVAALITSMDEPLAPCAGNGLEVREAVRYLTGQSRDERLDAVVMALCVRMLLLGGLAADEATAGKMLRHALDSGEAADRFSRMVAILGGPGDFLERCESYLPRAESSRPVTATRDGYLAAWDTRALGLAVVTQGGGRTAVGQSVDHSVGLTDIVRTATPVKAGDVLAVMHGPARAVGDTVRDMVRAAAVIEPAPREAQPIILSASLSATQRSKSCLI